MALYALAGLDVAIWLYLLLGHGFFWRVTRLDTSLPPLENWPEVCAVIPARNEADILDDTLPSLLTHDYPNLRIVLVDDRSEDTTAETARRIAEAYNAQARLTVADGQPLMGWKGKAAAMAKGLEQVAQSPAPPRYILFTDADIAYEKGALKQLVAQAEKRRCVLTSLMVRLRCESFAERWLIPAFVYFFQLLYPFRRVNTPGDQTAAAAGGCMLVRYDALMRAGGLAPIRTALIDDCALGRLMKPFGPIWLGLTQEVKSVRPYPHINDIRAMVARTAYDQLRYSPLILAGTVAGLALIFLVPVGFTFFGTPGEQLSGLLSWALMSASFVPLLRFYDRSPLLNIFLPFIAACYMAFTLDSALQYTRGRGGLWKGRAQAERASL